MSPSPQKAIVKDAHSDYDRYFLPFNLPAHTILAPKNVFMEDTAKMQAARARLDAIITRELTNDDSATIEDLQSRLTKADACCSRTYSVAEVIDCVNGPPDKLIDLTSDRVLNPMKPLDMLKAIPMKYIHFGEDVRPPYFGTYTQTYSDAQAFKLARNPMSRLRSDTNYDYDSEAEWDEPEEGEDLDSEDDLDADDDAEDDMDGFLDDEEDPQVKRRLISGDLQPISTGLCWQDEQGVSRLNDGSGAICTDFRDFAIGYLHRKHFIKSTLYIC